MWGMKLSCEGKLEGKLETVCRKSLKDNLYKILKIIERDQLWMLECPSPSGSKYFGGIYLFLILIHLIFLCCHTPERNRKKKR